MKFILSFLVTFNLASAKEGDPHFCLHSVPDICKGQENVVNPGKTAHSADYSAFLSAQTKVKKGLSIDSYDDFDSNITALKYIRGLDDPFYDFKNSLFEDKYLTSEDEFVGHLLDKSESLSMATIDQSPSDPRAKKIGDLYDQVVNLRSHFLTSYFRQKGQSIPKDHTLMAPEDYIRITAKTKVGLQKIDVNLPECGNEETYGQIPDKKIILLCSIDELDEDLKLVSKKVREMRLVSLTEYITNEFRRKLVKVRDMDIVTRGKNWSELRPDQKEWILADVNRDYSIKDLIKRACDPEASVNSAFADQITNEFVICPASLYSETPGTILFSLAHEISHIGDMYSVEGAKRATDQPQGVLKKLSDCLKKHGGRKDEHINEALADFWTSETLIQSYRAKGLNQNQAKAELAKALNYLCGFTEDSVHSSGNTIIDNMVRLSPSSREFFNLPASKTHPVCTMSGTVPPESETSEIPGDTTE